MATPIKFGTEFLVNTTTANTQLYPTITGLADGRFVVAWTDYSETGGGLPYTDVRAQVFNANGSAFGAEFVVNTHTIGDQKEPTTTALADGRFVVAWTDYIVTGPFTDGNAIQAQVFNGDGTKSGAEFLVGPGTLGQTLSAITALSGGGYVVTWQDSSQSGGDTTGFATRAQVFGANGAASGATFLVNTTTVGNQMQPAITGLANGRFVVAWQDDSATGGDTFFNAIRAQIYNADGSTFGADFQVNTTTASHQFEPAITALADGRFVVTYTDNSRTSGDLDSYDLRAQLFNADGSASGTEFLVNSIVTSDQTLSTITALADGRFVVAWTDGSIFSTGNGVEIRAQLFNADGSTSGAEFQANTTVIGHQIAPTISTLADGRFVVSWTDVSATGGDTSGGAIRAQIFDPREAAVTLSGTALNDDYVGTRFGDQVSGSFGSDTLAGAAGNDMLSGQQGDDRLFGGQGNDTLLGGSGRDRLSGEAGNDQLTGGLGADHMMGGSGADVFVFVSAAEAGTVAKHDRISDFTAGADHLDLATIQAGQAFIGAAGFGLVAGQVRYDAASGLLTGDLNGDGAADYAIELTNLAAITGADLIL